MILFVAFALLLSAGSVAPVLFEATGTITCNLHAMWCYHIYLMEIDTFDVFSDRLGREGTKCTYFRTIPYNITSADDYDGILDNYYEVAVEVRHNCTTEWSYLSVWSPTHVVAANTTEVYKFQFNKDVSYQGESVDSYYR